MRDAITTLFINSNQIPYQRQHNNSKCKLLVNKTRVHSHKFPKHDAHIPHSSNDSFTTKAKVSNYNSKFISSFNCHANHLLQIHTVSGPQIQITNSKLSSVNNFDNKINHIIMSAKESPRTHPPTSPQTPRLPFQTHSTPNTNASTSVNNPQTSSSPETRDIELSWEEIFENNLNQLFTKSFLAVLTTKDAVLKKNRDCVIQDDVHPVSQVSQYVQSFWNDLHVKSGCLCVDQRVAFPNSIKDAVIESIHMTHPGSWG